MLHLSKPEQIIKSYSSKLSCLVAMKNHPQKNMFKKMVSLKGIRKSWILYRALYRWPRSTTESDLMVWLVVEPYPWKIWVGQLGWWNPQYMESHKFHGSSMFQSPPTSAGEYQEIQKVHRKIRMESVGCGWEMWKQSCSLKTQPMLGSMWFHVACPSSIKNPRLHQLNCQQPWTASHLRHIPLCQRLLLKIHL